MKKHARWTAAFLAVLVVLALTVSLTFLLHEADHDCTGENCPVCAVIALCRNTLRSLFGGLLVVALTIAAGVGAAALSSALRCKTAYQTPVSLKVKLLN